MQVQEEAMMRSKHIFKGKRTKRQRTMSSFMLTLGTSSSSSGPEGSYGGCGVVVDVTHYSSTGGPDRFTASPSDSGELAQSSVEEEDMANCLILLAQGSSSRQKGSPQQPCIINRPVVDVYQCKTCDRCFPSFQALGGHRASHKKPKVNLEEKKPASLIIGNHESTVRLIKRDDTSTTLSLQTPGRDLCIGSNNKSRVHECSVCGAEFSSGQALGGHMRRHRPLPTVASSSSNEDSQEFKKQRTLLSLDLNLPAPEAEEDCRELKYPFTSKQEVMVFSASPLVDCHY